MVFDPGFLFMAGLAVVSVVFISRASARRRDEQSRAIAEFAAARGWTYRPSDPALVKAWSGPPFVGSGTATDVLEGTVSGRAFTAFEYSWTEGSGDDAHTVHRLVAATQLPAALPLLWVMPENFENRLTNSLGAHDIHFESAEFNQRFMVTADNDRYAYAVMQPMLMAYLMDTPAGTNPIRIEGNHALTWVDADFDPVRAEGLVAQLDGFVGRIPSFVYDQHATTAPAGYAGSVSGLRPEATPADLVRTAFVLVWGLIWLGISVPMTVFWYSGVSSTQDGWLRWGWVFPAAFVFIGLLVVISTLIKLVSGGFAIWHNQRRRQASV